MSIALYLIPDRIKFSLDDLSLLGNSFKHKISATLFKPNCWIENASFLCVGLTPVDCGLRCVCCRVSLRCSMLMEQKSSDLVHAAAAVLSSALQACSRFVCCVDCLMTMRHCRTSCSSFYWNKNNVRLVIISRQYWLPVSAQLRVAVCRHTRMQPSSFNNLSSSARQNVTRPCHWPPKYFSKQYCCNHLPVCIIGPYQARLSLHHIHCNGDKAPAMCDLWSMNIGRIVVLFPAPYKCHSFSYCRN